MRKNQSRDRTQSSWLQGVLHHSPPALGSSLQLMARHRVLICHENYTSSKVRSWMHIYLLLTGLLFVCLFLYRCPFTAHLGIRPKMFKKNMPILNFYLFIQNKQPDLLRCKFACVHDLKSIVGSFTEQEQTKTKRIAIDTHTHTQVLQLYFCRHGT